MTYYKRQLVFNIVSRVLKISIISLVVFVFLFVIVMMSLSSDLSLDLTSASSFVIFMVLALTITMILPISFIALYVGAILWFILPDKHNLLLMTDGRIALRAALLVVALTQVLLFLIGLVSYDVSASFAAMCVGAIPSLLLGLVVHKSTKAAALEVLPDEIDGKPKRKPKAETVV